MRADPARRRSAAASPASSWTSAAWSPAAASRACSRSPSPPTTSDSGLLYVNYTDTAGDSRDGRVPALRTIPAVADPDSARELLRIEDFAANHNGGLLLFGPDGELYPGIGDGGGAGDPERTAQDPDEPAGQAAADRPATTPARYEVAALGLRNPWRFSFDRATGDLWIGDVGQDTLEEIDAVTARRRRPRTLNFGWSAFEGTERFNEDQQAPGAIPPVLEYGRDARLLGDRRLRGPRPELAARSTAATSTATSARASCAASPAEPGRPARDDRELGLDGVGAELVRRGRRRRHVYAVSLDGPGLPAGRRRARPAPRMTMASSGRALIAAVGSRAPRARARGRSRAARTTAPLAPAAAGCGSTASATSTRRCTSTTPRAPTSSLFVVEQPGTISVLRDGKTLDRPFLDIRDRVSYGGEQGLLSVAFDPGYERNRRFYVYYVERGGQHRGRRVPAPSAQAPTRADGEARGAR